MRLWNTIPIVAGANDSLRYGSMKINFKRHKRPCVYYASSVGTFHTVLDVGDLVFKLYPEPGDNNSIPTIVSS